MDDTNKKATKELVDMIHYVAEESTKDAPYDRTRKGRIVEVHRNISTNEIIGYDVKIEDKEYYIKKEQGKNITASVNDIVYVNFPCNNVNNIYLSHIDGEEDIYAENEVKTNGVWIDGKPIYRKVLPFILNTAITTISHGISNIDNIISVKGGYGYADADAVDMYPIPYVALTASYMIEIGANLTIIYVKAGSSILLDVRCFAIIEYTKMT